MTPPRPLGAPLGAPLLACLLAAACAGDGAPPTAPAARASAAPLGAVATAAAGPGPLLSGLAANVCADVWQASRAPGAAVVAYPCHGGDNQQFVLQSNGTITAYDRALCLDVWQARANDGDPVVVYTCNGGANQQWTRTAAGELKTAVNGKCLDLWGAQPVAGAKLAVYTCHGGANQQWTVNDATPPGTPPGAPPAVDSPAGSWTYCSEAGTVCQYVGLRAVRLGPTGGPYVEQVAWGSVPCAVYGFGDRNPAPGRALHCDTGPLLTTTLANPMPGMGPLAGATVEVPRGGSGAAGPQARPTSETGVVVGSGSFRTTCGLAKYAFDDPIVFPGRPGAAHLHAFFGNTAVDGTTTPEQVAGTGSSMCRGGTLNRTAYWVPALVDAQTGAVQAPLDAVIYYKTGYNVDPAAVRAFPAGLRMIAGDMRATAAQRFVSWGCRDRGGEQATVPTTCPAGDAVRLTVIFPQCWDGRTLDAPDHKSHMAYPDYRNGSTRSTCPASHPVTLPEITEHFDYPVAAGAQPGRWRLSSDLYGAGQAGGLSAHADWMNGWDPATMQTIVTRCLNRAADCGVGAIGDGRALY